MIVHQLQIENKLLVFGGYIYNGVNKYVNWSEICDLIDDKKIRIRNLVEQYVPAGKSNLLVALNKLKDRLTSAELGVLEEYLHQENYELFIGGLLDYYDHTANYVPPAKPTVTLQIKTPDVAEIMRELLKLLTESGIIIS